MMPIVQVKKFWPALIVYFLKEHLEMIYILYFALYKISN